MGRGSGLMRIFLRNIPHSNKQWKSCSRMRTVEGESSLEERQPQVAERETSQQSDSASMQDLFGREN